MNQPRARATLVTACAAHLLHDGLSDLLYVIFPVWARAFSFTFAQVGLLKTGYSGALALFQIPAGFLSLLLFLAIAGLGSAVQHPLSSSLVSRVYEEGSRRVALGTYNFAGDLGKIILPTGVALITAWA